MQELSPRKRCEPSPRKRARVEPEDGRPKWEVEPDAFVHARRAIKLRFVDSAGALSDSFEPEFTHQLFEGEAIACPAAEQPLAIEVIYSPACALYYRLANDAPMAGAAEAAMYKLAEQLPDSARSLDELREQARAPFAVDVCGERLSEYTLPAAAGATYEIYCAELHDGTAARRAYAERLVSTFRWPIETWEGIDMADDRWRLISLVERGADGARRVVGGVTVFRFSRWASGGTQLLLRVCQIGILPPFRSKGHGGRLLQAVYAYAAAQGAGLVTVEDPNASFRLLRDLTDARNCLAKGLLKPVSTSSTPSAEQMAEARRELLITDEQCVRCHELQQYRMLRAELEAAGADDEAATKPFRLMIKRRLNKRHQEELDSVLSIAEQQAAEAAIVAKAGGPKADAAAIEATKQEAVTKRKERLGELYDDLVSEYVEIAGYIVSRRG